ncbi:MAG: C4-dicarboxylate ABC transporter substrate-binding protein [Deltaproteobacteria bacterium HGW-Deltaproteobacteria-18]|jgi:TRAP-type C4-dicarboxylate transport system substrate-binding protein|nr:MAG: C4-dicarboxylate ABC transporter substrate-binding protein [Deltaproteobacteria bacterium HGW-Deltaproteobacteria-18]
MRLFLRVATLAFIVLGMSAPTIAAGPVKLSYSNFFPPTHIQSILAEEWCREVEARSNGQVVIDYYPAGTLTKPKDCYDGVVQRISDIGLSALGYTKGRFPVLSGVDLPMGYTSGAQATALANAVYEQFKPKEFDDVHVLYFHAHGPGKLHTAGKAVTSMDELKGMKIRATGNSASVISALGGSPVAMSMPDSYQSIQKGVVNGGIYPVETNKGWKMGEVVDYLTDTTAVAYTTTFFVVINKDAWASLTPEVQKVLTEVSRDWIPRHGQAWDDSDKEGLEFFLAQQGNAVVTLDPAEAERWTKAMEPIFGEYEAECAKVGADGKAVLDFMHANLR